MAFKAFDNFISELTESIKPSDSYLPLPTLDAAQLCEGTGCDCGNNPPPAEAIYTRLQISDGVNFEIVKVVGCETGVPVVERGQDGTERLAFPAGSCVRFTWIQSNIDDFICDSDCAGGSGGCSCLLQSNTISITFGPEEDTFHLEIPNSYVNLGGTNGVKVAGNMYEMDISALTPGTSFGTHMIAVFDGSQHISLTLDDICAFCSTAATTGDFTVIAGTGMTVTRSGDDFTVSITPTTVAAGSYEGATVNAQGQFVNIPVGWPGVTQVAADLSVLDARVGVVEGVARAVQGGVAITVDSGGPTDIVNHDASGVAQQTYLGLTVNNEGHVSSIDTTATPIVNVLGETPIDVAVVDGVATVSLASSASVESYRWVGGTDASTVLTKGLNAVDGGAEIVLLAFDTALDNALYQVVVSGLTGTETATVSSRTPAGFTLTFSEAITVVYVTVVD